MNDMPDRGTGGMQEDRTGRGLILAATILAGLFILVGLVVFFGAMGSSEDVVGDDVWLRLSYVGQGAIPYIIAGGVLWLLAEYKSNNPTP